MTKIFFDQLELGAIAHYETCPQYAICRDYVWCVHNMDLPFDHILSPKALIPLLEFDEGSPKLPKLQKWMRQRIREIPMDGIFVMPFRPIRGGRNLSKWVMAGLMFVPAVANPVYKPHFEGSAKNAASYAYRILRSPVKSKHPIVRAAEETYIQKALLRAAKENPETESEKEFSVLLTQNLAKALAET